MHDSFVARRFNVAELKQERIRSTGSSSLRGRNSSLLITFMAISTPLARSFFSGSDKARRAIDVHSTASQPVTGINRKARGVTDKEGRQLTDWAWLNCRIRSLLCSCSKAMLRPGVQQSKANAVISRAFRPNLTFSFPGQVI